MVKNVLCDNAMSLSIPQFASIELWENVQPNETNMKIFFSFKTNSRGGIKIFKALADWRVTQNIHSPNQRKTCQNHVFAEHLYSVHFVCASPTRKTDHHDCVCVS
jgi:hypothetical protein